MPYQSGTSLDDVVNDLDTRMNNATISGQRILPGTLGPVHFKGPLPVVKTTVPGPGIWGVSCSREGHHEVYLCDKVADLPLATPVTELLEHYPAIYEALVDIMPSVDKAINVEHRDNGFIARKLADLVFQAMSHAQTQRLEKRLVDSVNQIGEQP